MTKVTSIFGGLAVEHVLQQIEASGVWVTSRWSAGRSGW